MEFMETLRWASKLLSPCVSGMPLLPKSWDKTNHSASLERFIVLVYDCASTILTLKECRKDFLQENAGRFKEYYRHQTPSCSTWKEHCAKHFLIPVCGEEIILRMASMALMAFFFFSVNRSVAITRV